MHTHSDTHLRLESRHTGEWLRLRRVREQGQTVLELEGGVPPGGEGPPEHIHVSQIEEGFVVSGVLSASVAGRAFTVQAGDRASFPAGVPHRWWNADDEPLVFKGRAIPAEDLDSFLQAMFAVLNAGPKGRPSLFHLAHVLNRHRARHRVVVMPYWVQRLVFPVVIAVGHLLGAYPATGWPGAPQNCTAAPETSADLEALCG